MTPVDQLLVKEWGYYDHERSTMAWAAIMYGALPGDYFLADLEAIFFLVVLTRVKGMKLRPDYPSGVK